MSGSDYPYKNTHIPLPPEELERRKRAVLRTSKRSYAKMTMYVEIDTTDDEPPSHSIYVCSSCGEVYDAGRHICHTRASIGEIMAAGFCDTTVTYIGWQDNAIRAWEDDGRLD